MKSVLRAFALALYALGAVALALAVITARVVISGEAEIARSTEELGQGHAIEATEHAARAAGWYAPGAPHVRVAYARLEALATAAEGHGDRDTALFAWRAVRSAAIETRWIVTPHEADKQRADAAIARLASLAPRPPGTRVEAPSEMERTQLEALARDESPDASWSIVLVFGAVLAALGAFWAARNAISSTGHIDWARARSGLILAVAGAIGYLVAVWRA